MAMTFRTDPATEEALQHLTQHEGVSKQEVLRRAILERAERLRASEAFEAAADNASKRWQHLLERLAEE